MDDSHHQSDSDALASALGAIGATNDEPTHHFHHQLQQPDFSVSHKSSLDGHHDENVVDVHSLDIPVQGEDDLHTAEDLDLGLTNIEGTDLDDGPQRTNSYGRPPSIRKACDLCHAAKQKCSGDRPSCTRCSAGGWACVYAPRQRRRTVPKEQKLAMSQDQNRSPNHPHLSAPPPPLHHQLKKRKLASRDSLGGFGSGEMDMKLAMGMAVDLGLTGEDEGDELMTMTDDQMLESIAIDGYLADLPLATFVHNLPYNAPPNPADNSVGYSADDYTHGGDKNFLSAAEIDQHTTSALREAIFSLNESTRANAGQDGTGDDGQGGDGQGEGAEAMDPHLALLDLSHAMPVEGEGDGSDNEHLHLFHSSGCSHTSLVPHILHLLTQHPLEPKPGSNTPLTLGVFSPLARSLRLFHALVTCPVCSSSPQQTLPQLALLSRTTTILTFPYPSIESSSVGSNAQITVHGARLTGTGLSEAIEQHIVGVVWDSWRAAIREIFANFERGAQEVITQSALSLAANGENKGQGQNGQGQGGQGGQGGSGGPAVSGPETQRAGLMFQAMSRLVTAMDEVEES